MPNLVVDDQEFWLERNKPARIEPAIGFQKTVILNPVGERGPKGDKGDVELLPHQVEEILDTLEARTLITKQAAVALNAYKLMTTDAAGLVVYADAANPAHVNRLLGLSVTAAAATADIRVKTVGEVVNQGWSFTAGSLIYVGLNGDLSTAPAGVFTQVVGYALNPTTIVLQPSLGILRAI